jgi:hypothetical protein
VQKPIEWINAKTDELYREQTQGFVSLCRDERIIQRVTIRAIIEFLNESMVQQDCDTCTNFKPKAPGAVLGACQFFSGDVVSTFGCKKHSRS